MTSAASDAPRPKRLGILGSFVWDVIHGRDVRSAPVEEWGGITYALSAADAALPEGWELVPLAKVGYDLAPQARRFVGTLRHAAPDALPIEVPHPNNRVTLRYHSDERRSECLMGGVPPWSWAGLQPLLRDLDALYINLISGFELDLATAQLIRQHFRGPIYCDLHSLLLGMAHDGHRHYRPLPEVAAWCACFDYLQVNEDELAMLAPDGLALAATAMGAGVRHLLVTLGKQGVVYFAAPGTEGGLTPAREGRAGAGALRTARVPASPLRTEAPGDPTGCGDVWGATYFARLLAGDIMDVALRRANDAAARNVEHRGATGLAHHLRGELHSS
ncbi:MAG: hypothetical protein RLZZ25_1296 [Gemmatimonadota bacterium]|jgi:sugar/nucleoside kinase (ribokinase family)